MSNRKPEEEDEIEQSKAPLLGHLIGLRSRLIKALIAFGIAFIFCFFFAKQIYNILVWPFVWVAGVEHSKFIYTALLEYFLTQLKLAMSGAAFLAFPVIAAQIYMFVAPGLYRNERKAFVPYLIATPIFFHIPFYYRDFRTGWEEGVRVSKDMGLYRQKYCGCIFSEKERFFKSK